MSSDLRAPGTLYVISAPSGAGKTTLVHALTRSDPHMRVSVSHTTRPRRPGEEDGVHYHFVSPEQFESMIREERFLEHARVFDHHYGTSRDWVLARLREGTDVVLEIDWQGARQIRGKYADALSIFIVPPSLGVLEQRLRGRRQDQAEVVSRRMHDAVRELSHWEEFDYLVVNDDFHRALEDLQAIARAQRLRTRAQAIRQRAVLESMLPDGLPD